MISRVKDALSGQREFVQITMQSLTEDGLALITVVPMKRSHAEELLRELDHHLHEENDK